MSQLLMAVDVVYAFSLPNLDHGFCFSEYTRVPYTRVPAAPPAPATAPRGINLATGVAAAAAVGAKACRVDECEQTEARRTSRRGARLWRCLRRHQRQAA